MTICSLPVAKLNNALHYYRIYSELQGNRVVLISAHYFQYFIFGRTIIGSAFRFFSESDLQIARGIKTARKKFLFRHFFSTFPVQ